MNKVITVSRDLDAVCPNDRPNTWKLVTTNRGLPHYGNPQDYFKQNVRGKVELRNLILSSKKIHGLLFYIKRSRTCFGYTLMEDGPDCPWDPESCVGLLIWKPHHRLLPATGYEKRQLYARSFLADYNNWLTDNVFCYTIESVQPDGTREMLVERTAQYGTQITDIIGGDLEIGDVVTVEGRAAYVFEIKSLPDYVTFVHDVTSFPITVTRPQIDVVFSVDWWKTDVANNVTKLGYCDWVQKQRGQAVREPDLV